MAADGIPIGLRNMVAFLSVSGGLGLSTLAASVAAELHRRGRRCTLIDADFEAGGLDVLLGIENEPGLRFGSLDAPLGRLDGEALIHELPKWDGIDVLAFDAWNEAAPEWWSVQAAVRALSDTGAIAVVDAGRGASLTAMPDVTPGIRVMMIELSVLGLARAKARLTDPDDGTLLVGVEPPGGTRRGAVDAQEASEYLGATVAWTMIEDRRVHDGILKGMGVIPGCRANRRTVERLCDRIVDRLGEGTGAPRHDGR